MGVQQSFMQPLVPFDSETRAWCASAGVHFQSFGLISAMKFPISSEMMQRLADKYDVTPQILLFRFAMGLDVVPLIFSVNETQMVEGLSASRVPMTLQDAEIIDNMQK